MSALKVAIVGAGVIGHHHAAVIAETEGIELAVVVDVALDRAREVADIHGADAVASLTEALSPERAVDIVAICTPSGLHADLAVEAMQAGRHVLIEKPIDVLDERAARIDEARSAAGVQATVISQHRFDASSEAVQDALDRGAFGRVTSGIASVPWWRSQEYYESGAWRGTMALDGGGALMNQGVHAVDLLCAFLGRPMEVFGYTALLAHTGIEVEDTAAGVVRFESGALGLLHATTAARDDAGVRIQVLGDAGGAVIEGDRLVSFSGEGIVGVPEESPEDAADGRRAHRRQYQDLLASIRSGDPVRVGTREARTALAVINGLYASASTGAPVEIPQF